MSEIEFVQNAAGRTVPTVVNGKAQIPYQGVGAFEPDWLEGGTSHPVLPGLSRQTATSGSRT